MLIVLRMSTFKGSLVLYLKNETASLATLQTSQTVHKAAAEIQI